LTAHKAALGVRLDCFELTKALLRANEITVYALRKARFNDMMGCLRPFAPWFFMERGTVCYLLISKWWGLEVLKNGQFILQDHEAFFCFFYCITKAYVILLMAYEAVNVE